MFQFAHKELLYLFGLVPVLILVFWWSNKRKKRLLSQYGDREIIEDLIPDKSETRPQLKLVLLLLALSFFVFGLAGPELGSKIQKHKRKGVQIIIALDVSNSMMAQDIQPNRLEKAKQAISKLVDRLRNDQIGLIVFAGEAYTQLPITTDYVSAKMFLSTINTRMVPVQGTAIGAAIDLAANSFDPNSSAGKAIIVITDGENHEDNPVASAQEAAKNGIQVSTIGVGSAEGAPIPIGDGPPDNFIKDQQGNVVISKLDAQLLQQIAAAGNGSFIRATNASLGLNTIFNQINKMNKAVIKSTVYSEFENQFQWPFAIALFFLFLEIIIFERKTRWSGKINIFQINK